MLQFSFTRETQTFLVNIRHLSAQPVLIPRLPSSFALSRPSVSGTDALGKAQKGQNKEAGGTKSRLSPRIPCSFPV